uniref:Uncharacterized protein n=1 Tax=Romanomermis culicivorax TaxID=13658 RepID=A0A915IAE3_ROMCU
VKYPNIVVKLCDNPKVVETIHVNRSKKFHANNVESQPSDNSMPTIKKNEAADQLSTRATYGSMTKTQPLRFIPFPGNDNLDEEADSSNEDV